MMAERGLALAHSTIMRWVPRFVPEFEKRWNRFARKAGLSWRVDETYVKIRGKWAYLYRAVDRNGQTVDFRLSSNRDVKAAKGFFRKALKSQGRAPTSITLDGYAASHRAVYELSSEDAKWKDTQLRSPGSNCCIESARVSSPSGVWALEAKLRLQSGMRCCRPETRTPLAHLARSRPIFAPEPGGLRK